MFEARLHGRGGQGIVTMAELLALAAFLDGHEAQAFPSFGSERMGAPVMSFCRISDTPIRVREPVLQPNAVVVADSTLLHHVDVFAGLVPSGLVLLNSTRSAPELGLEELVQRLGADRVVTVPATDIARATTGRTLPSAPLLGALAAVTGQVSMKSLADALTERFPAAIAQTNILAATAGFEAASRQAVATDA